ncbi:ATP-binding cassette domain-containing protein [Candidatus Babeliales bacterium]|nr:ATP-binding cassette domain-containing protein [Candidatus Babeliales bacterium]
MLTLKNISATLNNKKILKNISLQVAKGEISMLLGASGVGKSTLLRILNNLTTFDTGGSILLDNKSLDLKKVNIEHGVGIVFQHFNLFDHLTVEKNITIVLEKVLNKSKKEAINMATKLLNHYGLKELAKNYPSKLSGGQKQRLAIARTIALNPQIICFDEPTSALDPMLTCSVARNIQELASQNYIVLVASHDTLLLENLNCTINLMQNGTIVQSIDSPVFWNNREKYSQINAFIKGQKNNPEE